MAKYTNYLRKDPFSSFSQLHIDPSFYKKVVVPIINALNKPLKSQRIEHSSQEYSITTILGALLGYSQNTGPQILERKLYSILKEDTVRFVKDTRILPHPSQVNKYVNTFSMEDADSALLKVNKGVLMYLMTYGIVPKKIKIAFDFKKQLYYGDKNDPYVIGIKAEKGTKAAHFWHSCAIIAKGMELLVGSQMVESRTHKKAFVEKLIDYLESLGFIVEFVAMDKEYYDKDVMSYLDSKGITYDVPARECKKLKAAKEEALKDPNKRVQDYEIKGKHVKGKGFDPYKFKIGFYAKKGLRFNTLRSIHRKNPAAIAEILSNIFVLATNQAIYAPSPQRKYKFYKLRGDYRDRWRFETANREENPFLIPSCSKIPEVRNLYFVIALLLYNLWVIANLFLHRKKPQQAKEPKAFFIVYVHDLFLAILQFYLGYDPPQSEFCRTEELNIMREIIM
jgi:hypothetical protein